MLRHIRHTVGTALGRPRRWRYLEHLPKHGVGAEIGVFRGEFTPHLVRVAKPRVLHLIDCWWTLYGETYPDWGMYTDHGRLSTRQAFEETLCRVRGGPCVLSIGDDLEILAQLPDDYFDWVYLDTSHQYDHTLQELELLKDKVRPGGVVMGDDWIVDPADVNHGCSVAVREFCDAEGWQLGPIDADFLQWRITAPG